MRLLATVIVAAAALSGSAAVLADTIQSFNFTFTDPGAGNLQASGTLTVDLTTDQALSGTGSINSSLFVATDGVTPLGTQSMGLVTATNAYASAINGGPYANGSFQWQDSDGTNLLADTYFSATASPYVDSTGILFAVGAPNSGGRWASLNIWYQGGTTYWDFLGNGGAPQHGQIYNTSASGEFTVAPVPLPAALPLVLSGLAGFGMLFRRRQGGPRGMQPLLMAGHAAA